MFLTNDMLRSVQVVEFGDVAMVASELLEQQQSVGGQTVVGEGLRKALFKGYQDYWISTGKKPDVVTNRSFPELHFIPVEKEVFGMSPSGIKIPNSRKLIIFIAVKKKFSVGIFPKAHKV